MKKSSRITLIVLLLALILAGAAVFVIPQITTSTDGENLPPKKLIIDSDIGADDASALILAAKSESADILGVTTLAGNVDLEQSTKNALAALELAGCDAPVFKGADTTFSGKKIEKVNVFGTDGMGDAGLVHPTGKAQEKDAVSFILETVAANPGEIEIVLLGSATNIAEAIQKDPETMKNVKRIWSMGTTGLGPGNASPVAEFNVYHDAEAYKVMLDSGIPITVVGLDMCDGDARWTNDQFDKLSGESDIEAFVENSLGKIREFYASNGTPDSVMVCDPLAMMCCLDPSFTTSSIQAHGSCITQDGETYGQVLFYQKGFTYDVVKNDFDYNVTLTTGVDGTRYFNQFYTIINS